MNTEWPDADFGLPCKLIWRVKVKAELTAETVELSTETAVIRIAGDTVLSPPAVGTKVELHVDLPLNGNGQSKLFVCRGVVERVIQLEKGDRLVRCMLHHATFGDATENAPARRGKSKTAWTM